LQAVRNLGAESGSLVCHGCQIWQDSLVLEVRKKPPALGEALRGLLERVPEPAILLGADYRVLAANPAYLKRYGAIAFGERRCFEVSHGYGSPCDENGESCPLKATLETGRRQRVFHVHHGPEGPLHVDVELEPVVDEDGRAVYFLERLREVTEASASPRGEFVGRSPAFLEALGLIRRAGPSEVPVLLLGESGTGKELAARAVHRASRRSGGPFVPVECSGLPEALFESELFGHEAGAFTGAARAKRGLVDAAAGGTLFLDELGDIPLALQVKLLRLLESGMFRRVGGVEPQRADFRLICATHRDLGAMVREGTFRQDLFFRVNVFPLTLPPLRERLSDLPLLAEALLAERYPGKRLTREALALLARHPFPGNVRELRNLLERMALLTDGDELRPEHLPAEIRALQGESLEAPRPAPAGRFTLGPGVRTLEQLEASYLRWAEGQIPERAALARALGVSERTLYRKLEEARKHAASES
jgi:DNA-binding NtrC family response regulator